VSTDQNADPLDWDTYKALVAVVQEWRSELIAERESESCPEWRRRMLLDQQVACSEIHARMFERVTHSRIPGENKKES
jgi:hypothetical protein